MWCNWNTNREVLIVLGGKSSPNLKVYRRGLVVFGSSIGLMWSFGL